MNGTRLLYTASLDRMCTEGRHATGFRGAEILVTVVDN